MSIRDSGRTQRRMDSWRVSDMDYVTLVHHA